MRPNQKCVDDEIDQRGDFDPNPKVGAFSGRPLPSILSFKYLVRFTMRQGWANAKLMVAQGQADKKTYDLIEGWEIGFARNGRDPRDYGFEDATQNELEVPRGATRGRA